MPLTWRRLLVKSSPSRAIALAAALLWTLLPYIAWAGQGDQAWVDVPYCAASTTPASATHDSVPLRSDTVVLHFASALSLLGVEGLAACLPANGPPSIDVQMRQSWQLAHFSPGTCQRSLRLPGVRGPPRESLSL